MERSSVNDSELASAEIIAAGSTMVADAEPGPSDELWIVLLLLALVLVVAEWVTYHKRVTV
jgi:hypothetical protein